MQSFHGAFNGETHHFVHRIGTHGNGFLEMSWKFATTVVGDIDHSTLAWLDGSLGVGGNRASAAGKWLMNGERVGAIVSEFERTVDNMVLLT